MKTIIFAHPWEKSYNQAILNTVIEGFEENKIPYQIIDLYKDEFNPVLSKKELSLFSKGETTDFLVKKYQKMLLETEELIFIFPVWWYDLPAILKGFMDKVMLKKFSYVEGKFGLTGQLTHIKKATVITTAQSPKWYLKLAAGNLIQGTFIKATLKSIGIRQAKWLHLGQISSITKEKRTSFLEKAKKVTSA